MSSTPMSLAQFGQTIKAKHPEYSDLADEDVGQKVLAKYPQYSDMVKTQAVPQSTLDTLASRSANPTQFEKDRSGGSGAIMTTIKNLAGGLMPSGVNPYPGMGLDQKTELANQAYQHGQDQKAAGYSAPYRALSPVAQSLGVNVQGMEQDAARGNTGGVIGNALTPLAAYGIIRGGGAALDAMPNAARAGEAFQKVSGVVGDQPVDVGNAGNVALQAQDLANTGTTLPKPLRDFLKRASDPSKGPITFDEARQFQSNASRLTKKDSVNASPAMRRQVAIFADELGKATQSVADQGGVGQDFSGAMQEYGLASNNAKMYQGLKTALAKGAVKSIPYGIGGLLAGAGYKMSR